MAKFTDTISNIFNSGIEGYEKFKMTRRFSKADPRKYNKTILGGIFEEVPREEAKEFYSKITGYKMNYKAGVLGSIGIAGAIAGSTALEIEHNSRLSNVNADQLANMVTHTVSPTLERDLEDEEMLQDSLQTSQYGVEPNIVFALHELRN